MLQYSVLMAVHADESPQNFKTAIESILNQTIKTNNFVLVCDGPLSNSLNKIIEQYRYNLDVIRLPRKMGLWHALNVGLTKCKNELVARMDSDDISLHDRMQNQLLCFEQDSDLGILSGTIIEFNNKTERIIGARRLPSTNKEIIDYSRKRCPFNHPCIMYKKSLVLSVGGYCGQYSMEDYHLWIKLLGGGV